MLNKRISEKIYLEELPEISSIIENFIKALSPAYDDGYLITETEAIECRRRDGFIPHSHNYGGFDKQYMTDLMSILGSGCSIGNISSETACTEQTLAMGSFFYDNRIKYAEILKLLPVEKQNYHDLIQLGHEDIAEELDEYCCAWLRQDTIYYGYRAMYEGVSSNGWHTLCIYASINRSEHWCFCGAGSETILEIEIKFRSTAELIKKLEQHKIDLESAF